MLLSNEAAQPTRDAQPEAGIAGGGGSETSRLLPGGSASATAEAATATGIDPNVSVEADPEVGRTAEGQDGPPRLNQ